jgi:hypothetical protein
MGNNEVAATVALLAVRHLGPLEMATYKADWKASHSYRRHVEEIALRRKLEAAARAAQDQIMKAAGVEKSARTVEGAMCTSPRRGFAALRKSLPDFDEDDGLPERDVEAPTPGRIAARLLLARLFDRNPSVMEQFRTASPVVIVDVPDAALYSRVAHQWKNGRRAPSSTSRPGVAARSPGTKSTLEWCSTVPLAPGRRHSQRWRPPPWAYR